MSDERHFATYLVSLLDNVKELTALLQLTLSILLCNLGLIHIQNMN